MPTWNTGYYPGSRSAAHNQPEVGNRGTQTAQVRANFLRLPPGIEPARQTSPAFTTSSYVSSYPRPNAELWLRQHELTRLEAQIILPISNCQPLLPVPVSKTKVNKEL